MKGDQNLPVFFALLHMEAEEASHREIPSNELEEFSQLEVQSKSAKGIKELGNLNSFRLANLNHNKE